MQQINWYNIKVEDIILQFNSRIEGLNSEEAQEHEEVYGKNVLKEVLPPTMLSVFLGQFRSPFAYVLLGAVAIVLFLGHFVDAVIIFAVLLLNAVIGTFQEGKAQATLSSLQKVVKSYATVIRSGKPVVIEDSQVVAGDIIMLKDGDLVPADSRLIEANDVQVNESALTGESTLVHKEAGVIDETKVPVADQTNMIFKGTYVVSGLATAIVVRTGQETHIGTIAQKLQDIDSDVPLKKNIENLSRAILMIVTAAILIVFVVGILQGKSAVEMFITSVALAVSAIPESLPVVVTLVLALGVWNMSQKKVLVKHLQAVEALGQAQVIAVDKTGTVTKNQMNVEKLFMDGQYFDIEGDGYKPEGRVMQAKEIISPTDERLVLAGRACAFTAVASITYDTEKEQWQRLTGDPTEVSLLVFAQKLGIVRDEIEEKFKQVYEIPFDFHAKHHTAVNLVEDDERFLTTAGSPDVLLEHSTTIWKNGRAQAITHEDREELAHAMEEMSTDGYRIIALACSFNPPEKDSDINKKDLPDLTFLGLVAIADSIRAEVADSVAQALAADMRVVMITGDRSKTAEAIARKVGIFEEGDVILTGRDLDELSDEDLIERLRRTTIFARVSPEHKMRIVSLYKKSGQIIAMTGDGVNDALSLVAADLGVSMGKGGTEVAREASDIVLLDDNFGHIIDAAEEGKQIYHSIQRTVSHLLSTNMGELLVITIAVLLGWPLPLLATQIIWLNMVTDSFLITALVFEPREKDLLLDKSRKPSKWIIDGLMLIRMSLVSIVMTVVTLVLFVQFSDVDLAKAQTMALALLTTFQLFNIMNVRSYSRSIFSQNPFKNRWLFLSIGMVITLTIVAIYTPFMNTVLHTVPLAAAEWGLILCAGLTVIVAEEIRKIIYRAIKGFK